MKIAIVYATTTGNTESMAEAMKDALAGNDVYYSAADSADADAVLASDVIVKKGAVVKNSIVMGDVTIEEDAVIEYAIIDENVSICKGAKIGEPKEKNKGIAVVGRNTKVYEGATVEGGRIVDKDVTKGDN